MGRAIFATAVSLVLPRLGHFFLGLRRGVWFAVPRVVLLYLYWASLVACGDGRALLSVVPRHVGVSTVAAGMAASPRATASDRTARILVLDRRRAIVLVSLAALVARSRSHGLEIPLPRSGAKRPAPEAGAVQALKELDRRAYLLYMTGDDRLELPELHE